MVLNYNKGNRKFCNSSHLIKVTSIWYSPTKLIWIFPCMYPHMMHQLHWHSQPNETLEWLLYIISQHYAVLLFSPQLIWTFIYKGQITMAKLRCFSLILTLPHWQHWYGLSTEHVSIWLVGLYLFLKRPCSIEYTNIVSLQYIF